ncbi:MAG TPA: hypothetical protein VK666_10170 [Chryseolinea sp.]|nr:hypothetical protein [Chryseolinea sp.]
MFYKKIVVASLFFALIITLAVVFRPVPVASVQNTLKAFGTVEGVYKSGEVGVVFKLRGDDRLFYLEEGFQNGLSATALQETLLGQIVEIYYVKYWSPLDPLSKLKYIAKVDVNRITLYSAIKY